MMMITTVTEAVEARAFAPLSAFAGAVSFDAFRVAAC